MASLHLITRSSFQSTLPQNVFLRADKGDAFLFMNDGVYCCLSHSNIAAHLMNHKCFALQADVTARAIKQLAEGISVIDYDAFVSLTLEYDRVATWY